MCTQLVACQKATVDTSISPAYLLPSMNPVLLLMTTLGRPFCAWLLIGCAMLLVGYEYIRPTMNAPLARWDADYGYCSTNLPPSKSGSSDSLFIVAPFSGGGARASALSYGVLQELARTLIVWEGRQKWLVDELNIIHAVSGGSFPATYDALYNDRIFQDFEGRFLRKNWERELRSRIFRSPSNWFRLWSAYFGHAHIFAELLDVALFDGHISGDLLAKHRRSLINLHASDTASLSRFKFNQRQFDLICSELNQLLLSVAAASSSAIPLLLSLISMTNYAGRCGFQPPARLIEARPTAWGRQRTNCDPIAMPRNAPASICWMAACPTTLECAVSWKPPRSCEISIRPF
jgi:NTE family protein